MNKQQYLLLIFYGDAPIKSKYGLQWCNMSDKVKQTLLMTSDLAGSPKLNYQFFFQSPANQEGFLTERAPVKYPSKTMGIALQRNFN